MGQEGEDLVALARAKSPADREKLMLGLAGLCEGAESNGMLNSVGLQNPGVDHVIAHELPELRKVFRKPIVSNISGFSIDEYVSCVEKLTKEQKHLLEELGRTLPQEKLDDESDADDKPFFERVKDIFG